MYHPNEKFDVFDKCILSIPIKDTSLIMNLSYVMCKEVVSFSFYSGIYECGLMTVSAHLDTRITIHGEHHELLQQDYCAAYWICLICL